MHGGMLTLENAEGGGTLVTISIPTGGRIRGLHEKRKQSCQSGKI